MKHRKFEGLENFRELKASLSPKWPQKSPSPQRGNSFPGEILKGEKNWRFIKNEARSGGGCGNSWGRIEGSICASEKCFGGIVKLPTRAVQMGRGARKKRGRHAGESIQ